MRDRQSNESVIALLPSDRLVEISWRSGVDLDHPYIARCTSKGSTLVPFGDEAGQLQQTSRPFCSACVVEALEERSDPIVELELLLYSCSSGPDPSPREPFFLTILAKCKPPENDGARSNAQKSQLRLACDYALASP